MRLLFGLLLGMVVSMGSLSAQKIDKVLLNDFFKPAPKSNFKGYLKSSSNELETTFTVLFLGYKSFFSSQDIESCVFYPSCSVYAVQCFQHDKPFIAPFKIMDRLTRCHPFASPKQYDLLISTGKFYDPIDN